MCREREPIGNVVERIVKEARGYKTIPQFLNDIGTAFNLPYWDWSVVEVDDHMEVVNTVGDTVFEIELGDRETIEEVAVYYTVLIYMVDKTTPLEEMNCPLCLTGVMEYRSLPNEEALNEAKVTHVWVCDNCPNVMLEWYDKSDSVAMVNHFS